MSDVLFRRLLPEGPGDSALIAVLVHWRPPSLPLVALAALLAEWAIRICQALRQPCIARNSASSSGPGWRRSCPRGQASKLTGRWLHW